MRLFSSGPGDAERESAPCTTGKQSCGSASDAAAPASEVATALRPTGVSMGRPSDSTAPETAGCTHCPIDESLKRSGRRALSHPCRGCLQGPQKIAASDRGPCHRCVPQPAGPEPRRPRRPRIEYRPLAPASDYFPGEPFHLLEEQSPYVAPGRLARPLPRAPQV